MISLILLKLFTFSQILQGVPKLPHATVLLRVPGLFNIPESIGEHRTREWSVSVSMRVFCNLQFVKLGWEKCEREIRWKKKKTEETHLLLNTHAVKCNELLILCVFCKKKNYCSESLIQPTKRKKNCEVALVIRLRDSKYFWSWNNECIKKALSDGKREEQPNMDGNLLARRIVCIAVRERATNSS